MLCYGGSDDDVGLSLSLYKSNLYEFVYMCVFMYKFKPSRVENPQHRTINKRKSRGTYSYRERYREKERWNPNHHRWSPFASITSDIYYNCYTKSKQRALINQYLPSCFQKLEKNPWIWTLFTLHFFFVIVPLKRVKNGDFLLKNFWCILGESWREWAWEWREMEDGVDRLIGGGRRDGGGLIVFVFNLGEVWN